MFVDIFFLNYNLVFLVFYDYITFFFKQVFFSVDLFGLQGYYYFYSLIYNFIFSGNFFVEFIYFVYFYFFLFFFKMTKKNFLFLYFIFFFIFLNYFLYTDLLVLHFSSFNLIYNFSFYFFKLIFLLDSLSIIFLVLNFYLFWWVTMVTWNLNFKAKELNFLFYFLSFFLLHVFSTSNLLFFYLFFEITLIPLFLLIGVWGSRVNKIYATYYLFFYTFIGSFFMLIMIFFFWSYYGTLDVLFFDFFNFYSKNSVYLFILFFISFSVKLPVYPIHLWLPEAHVEAPTSGSILLAGIILKIAGYGIFRFLIPIFPYLSVYFSPVFFVIFLFSLLYSSLTAITQLDLKKLIAYTSVAHMNFAVLGLFTFFLTGAVGAFITLVSHALVSGSLFMLIGFIYERYKTRYINYFGGLIRFMPIYSFFFFFFSLANMGFPGTLSFLGELYSVVSIFQKNFFLGFLSILGLLFSVFYSLLLFSQFLLGSLKFNYLKFYCDLTKREFFLCFVNSFFILICGFFPTQLTTRFLSASFFFLSTVFPYIV